MKRAFSTTATSNHGSSGSNGLGGEIATPFAIGNEPANCVRPVRSGPFGALSAGAVIAVCLSGCGRTERIAEGEVAGTAEAIHDGGAHTNSEPAIFDLTAPLCAMFMGSASSGYADDLLPAAPENIGTEADWWAFQRESAQGYGGGYAPVGMNPPLNGNPPIEGTLQPTAACVEEFPGTRSVELTRKRIHCSCASDACKQQFPNDEVAQAHCTPDYGSCFFAHTSCNKYFRVEARGTARGFVPEVASLPLQQAEIGAFYNDLADPLACNHEHAIYYAFVRGPGTNWTYFGSYAEGTNGTGTGPGGCGWTTDNFFGFGVPPVTVLDSGTRIAVLVQSQSHGSHSSGCGYFGCFHPVGVRIDYAALLNAQGGDSDAFWVGEDDEPLPPAFSHSAGESSQVIPAAGVNVLRAPTLDSAAQTLMGDEVWIDIHVPAAQADPDSVGSVELRVSIPSAGIPSRTLGVKNLTLLPRGEWSKLRFPLTTEIRDVLRQPHADVRFSLVASLTSTLEPALIDNFRFAMNLEQVGQSPVARCRNVGVLADGSGSAPVSPQMIDAGSSDPNGEPTSLTLAPAGPFPLGTTSVTLHASDGTLTTTCNATITVVDSVTQSGPLALRPLAWYRSSGADVLQSGGAVNEWLDASGNGHHLAQSNAGRRPHYSPTGWSESSPAVTFDGVDDFLEHTAPGSGLFRELAGEDNPFSVLVTWEPLDLDSDYDLAQWDNGGENGGNSLIELRTNAHGDDEAKYRHRRGDGVTSLLNTGTVRFSLARRTTAFAFDGKALSIYDGPSTHLSASANDRGPLTLVRFRLGHGDNAPLNARIAEVVVTNFAVSGAMYEQYRTYAQQQWGGLGTP